MTEKKDKPVFAYRVATAAIPRDLGPQIFDENPMPVSPLRIGNWKIGQDPAL
ncbi:hypothetical protein NBRC3293_1294 [Gluconobacter oxydans NBRC 3293]|uniref:Uncharacterized protein n=1 Tax=Gluconobacter oxydans NBRC 3293 TaxID=1315969 RepID=A0A829X1S3_GLUOY|nr:hypothetical protein NBRC3293_1294 [Gluconobacter oxydans NBRC 3293]